MFDRHYVRDVASLSRFPSPFLQFDRHHRPPLRNESFPVIGHDAAARVFPLKTVMGSVVLDNDFQHARRIAVGELAHLHPRSIATINF